MIYYKQLHNISSLMIKSVSDLRQVGGFLRFPLPIKLTTTLITEILLTVELNTINQTIEEQICYTVYPVRKKYCNICFCWNRYMLYLLVPVEQML